MTATASGYDNKDAYEASAVGVEPKALVQYIWYKDGNETKLIVPEDIYKLSLKVRMGEKSFYFEDKIIVASKLMNGFSDAHYDQITFDR